MSPKSEVTVTVEYDEITMKTQFVGFKDFPETLNGLTSKNQEFLFQICENDRKEINKKVMDQDSQFQELQIQFKRQATVKNKDKGKRQDLEKLLTKEGDKYNNQIEEEDKKWKQTHNLEHKRKIRELKFKKNKLVSKNFK